MSDFFIGEIRLFPYSRVPEGWARCNGALLPIQKYQALYALIGLAFGGDGKNTFALPNLQGRTIVGASAISGVPRTVGATGGTETVTLTSAQMPAHAHTVMATATNGTTAAAAGNIIATPVAPPSLDNPPPPPSVFGTGGASMQALNVNTVGVTGGNAAHENRQPFTVLVPCIATTGIFPPRS